MTTPSKHSRATTGGLLVLILSLPLLGAILRGAEWREFFRFPPPLEIPTDYVHFSWPAAGSVLLALTVIAGAWVRAARNEPGEPRPIHSRTGNKVRFPLWGWAAWAWTVAVWTIAWTRSSWFVSIQPYTFFPLWLGFIVGVNAVTQSRTGTCLMRRTPSGWLALFGISAVFWWIFEWLNRFVHNWHYLGVTGFDAVSYAVHASLCFSTVLPAVTAVAEVLASFRGFTARTSTGPAWGWFAQQGTGAVFGFGGISALILTGAFPQWFYPALWVAPLSLVLGETVLRRRSNLAQEIAAGDWKRAAVWMTAALICGFFWELWNYHSLAKWIYTVPGVERWHLFEMPLLGYAGYLPFGLECLLVVERLGVVTLPPPRAD